MKKSLRGRFVGFYLAILLTFFLMMGLVLLGERTYTRRFRELLSVQQELTGLYSLLEETQEAFYQYSLTPSSALGRKNCEENLSLLEDAAGALQERRGRSWSEDLSLLSLRYGAALERTLSGEEDPAEGYLAAGKWYEIILDNFPVFTFHCQEESDRLGKRMEQREALWIGMLLALFGGAALGELWMVRGFTRLLLKPVENLTSTALMNLSGGELATISPQGEGEVLILCQAFNQMIGKIKRQMEEEQEHARTKEMLHLSQERELEEQMKTLQSRINSHFLFNTLNVMGEMAWEENAPGTSQMLELLAGYLRYSLENLDKMVTLGREADHVQDYFAIMRVRFQDRIRMEVDVEEALRDAAVPSMILQPLVENAYQHGVSFRKKEAWIRLRGRLAAGEVRMEVEDNGAGMSPERIEEILKKIDGEDAEAGSSGIGLRSVAARIRKKLKAEVRVEVYSREGEGTRILLAFPYRRLEGGGKGG